MSQVLRHLESVPSCNTTSEEVAKLIASLSEFAPLVDSPKTSLLLLCPGRTGACYAQILMLDVLCAAGGTRVPSRIRDVQHCKPAPDVGGGTFRDDRQGACGNGGKKMPAGCMRPHQAHRHIKKACKQSQCPQLNTNSTPHSHTLGGWVPHQDLVTQTGQGGPWPLA